METFITFAKDFGFPAAVAAFVLLRLDRRLAQVERCLVRICVILTATTGVRVEEPDTPPLDEPSSLHPVPRSEPGPVAPSNGG